MLKSIKSVYFIGIGGIGMSALARYFHLQGMQVSGYDKTATQLTTQLISEGITIRFHEAVSEIPKQVDWVIYTPAIPVTHTELQYYQANGYTVLKRSEALQIITENSYTIAIAGSHGKTTVSSMLAHILHHSGYGCTAFVGGIMSNYNSNFVNTNNNKVVVVEADEFDRSFLHLQPQIAIITAVDTDHLDIYQTPEAINSAFETFCQQVDKKGFLLLNQKVALNTKNIATQHRATYSLDNAASNFNVSNIEIKNGQYNYQLRINGKPKAQFALSMYGLHNIENSVAATAVALQLGLSIQAIQQALNTFKGIKRRFEYVHQSKNLTIIDDYAHHPREIDALLRSVKHLYPTKKVTVLFQPHLYTRTRDLASEFAKSLSAAHKVIMLNIYPAREQPIAGISSAIIYDGIQTEKYHCHYDNALALINKLDIEVLLTVGAGNIDKLVQPIVKMLTNKKK